MIRAAMIRKRVCKFRAAAVVRVQVRKFRAAAMVRKRVRKLRAATAFRKRERTRRLAEGIRAVAIPPFRAETILYAVRAGIIPRKAAQKNRCVTPRPQMVHAKQNGSTPIKILC